MRIETSPGGLQDLTLGWKANEGAKITLVPTMGALHDGHLKLVERAKREGSRVIVSIFVNPLQFGPNEDFHRYPRPFEEDCAKLSPLGVDAVFHPTPEELYPKGFTTRIQVSPLDRHLCGRSRPGHFEGVATVCLKLFLCSRADVAVFGEKDFQQLAILRRIVTDLNVPLHIIGHPIVRENDGLAMSSRNRYLSSEERQWAVRIPESFARAASALQQRPDATVGEITSLCSEVLTSVPLQIDYIAIAQESDLVPVDPQLRVRDLAAPRLFVAVKAGTTRLIDNGALHSGGEQI